MGLRGRSERGRHRQDPLATHGRRRNHRGVFVTAREPLSVAALFVEPAGVYANLPGVDLWDEARDARLYTGPYPAVAHPPCTVWSMMRNCRPAIITVEVDGGFSSALHSLRPFGG